ncbi:MAG TPA: hypothetical protein VIW24_24785 [Aldersonia sp.]
MSETVPVAPKDVFARVAMPSWWERRAGIRGRDAADRHYLAFLAARFRDDPQVAKVDEALRDAVHAHARGVVIRQIGGFLIAVALVVLVVADAAAAGVVFVIALPALVLGNILAIGNSAAVRRHDEARERAEAARARLYPDVLHADDAETVRALQASDEGKLAYCAAMIAAEIARDPAWRERETPTLPVDLHLEITVVAERARQLIDDREAVCEHEQGRLRAAPDVRALAAAERRAHDRAVGSLAARVSAFADYRDRILLHRIAQTYDSAALRRAAETACDEQARTRMEL